MQLPWQKQINEAINLAIMTAKTTLFPARAKRTGPYGSGKPPPDGCRFYVGIEHASGNAVTEIILGLTRQRCRPPYVLGPDRPAVHAFCYWREPDGTVWRLDAAAPNARLTKYRAVTAWRGSVAVWECLAAPEGVKAAILKTCEMDGAPYGFLEGAAQAIPMLDTVQLNPEAYICSHMSWVAAAKCGILFQQLFSRATDWLPETCGQTWAGASSLFGARHA